MQISTRTRYGVRLLLELAVRHNLGFIQLREIAKAQDISLKYLEQIIRILRTGGLVLAQRGIHGGYALTRKPSQINMREIIEKLEGSLSLVPCKEKKFCNRINQCAASILWKLLSDSIQNTLENITLGDLVENLKRLENQAYYEI